MLDEEGTPEILSVEVSFGEDEGSKESLPLLELDAFPEHPTRESAIRIPRRNNGFFIS